MHRNIGDDSSSKDIIWIGDDPTMYLPTAKTTEYTIGELAGEFNLTLRALRFYESRGLLAPQRNGKARRYSQDDHRRLALILQGKRLGFTLGEIRELIAARNGHPDPGSLHLSRKQCLEQIRLLERQKREIEAALAELRRSYTALYTTPAGDSLTNP